MYVGDIVSPITMRKSEFYHLNYCNGGSGESSNRYDENAAKAMNTTVYEGNFNMYDRNLQMSFMKYTVGEERYNE